MARSLNRVQLIGNLTRDPELRYTPTGSAVCSFSLATNRTWTTDDGQKHEEADFHRIVAWNKLAELCSQFLTKGRKVYVEGRLSTRSWTTQDGQQRSTTEIIIDDMILLDPRRQTEEERSGSSAVSKKAREEKTEDQDKKEKKETKETGEATKEKSAKEEPEKAQDDEEVVPDDIPF